MPPRPSPSAPRSSTCSARRREAGTAASRDSERQGHSLRGGGHEARSRRHLLLPVLLAVQEHVGWISPGALNHIAERLTVPPADVYGVATFYALLSVEPRPPRVVHVCEDLACRCNGSQELIAQLEEHLGAEGELNADGSGTWLRSPCLGQCDRAPAAMVTLAGEHPEEHVLAPVTAQRGAGGHRRRPVDGADPVTPLPQDGDPSLRLLARVGRVDPTSLDDYRAARRLRGAAARDRARRRGRDPRAQGLAPDGPRRRRLPDRRQVGGGRAPGGASALPDLQRRRVRARARSRTAS